MSAIFFFLAVLVGVIAVALLVQGVVTLLVAWLVTGNRPALGTVIRANVLSGIAYVLAIILVVFQLRWLESLPIPFEMLMMIIILLPLLISAWVFARHLNLTLMQGLAIVVVVNVLNFGLGLASYTWIPDMPRDIPQEMRHMI